MANHFGNTLWLAARDYVGDWKVSGFTVLALAAVLGPMLILFALKFGVVGSMLDKLIRNPANLEIQTKSPGRFDHAWLQNLGSQPGVNFVLPDYPEIAGTVKLEANGRILQSRLQPTAEGDPLLRELAPPGAGQILLSQKFAQQLSVEKGQTVEASISRVFRDNNERVTLPLVVSGVLAEGSDVQQGGLVALSLIEALSDFREGRAVAEYGWAGDDSAVKRVYSGFRLYVKTLQDVAPLQTALGGAGVETRSRSADIEIVESVDRNLSTVYWLVAAIGLIGYALSLAANLWANIDRKRRDMAVLRLVGFRTGDIVWLPVIQAMFTAILGWLLASAMYLGVAALINRGMAGQVDAGQAICRLLPEHFAAALALTVIAAVLSAALAGYRASRIEPSRGLREL